MPKTTSAPSISSERTRICAPVSFSSTTRTGAVGAERGACPEPPAVGDGACGRWARTSGVGLVIALRLSTGRTCWESCWYRETGGNLHWYRETGKKRARVPGGTGASASTTVVGALGDKYSQRPGRH